MHKDKIEVFYLPSYSSELNPDERLNADLKHAITTSMWPMPLTHNKSLPEQ